MITTIPISSSEPVAALPTAARTGSSPHVDSLDGLRAIAVIGVMMYHASVPGGAFGWIGVDLFFVLSGFLITWLLVREKQRSGRIALAKFWGRRFLRLMPAYWLFVGVITILICCHVGWTAQRGPWTPGLYIASLWGYFANYADGTAYIWQHQNVSDPLWSLSVEEQFYFLWPGLCALALMTRRPAIWGWGLVGVTIACRIFAPDDHVLHVMLQTRGISIVLGCAAALSVAAGPPRWLVTAARSRAIRATVVAAIAGFVTWATRVSYHKLLPEETIHRLCVPIAAALFTCLVLILWYGPRDLLARALSWKPLAYVGRISYGVYLYHAAAQMLVFSVIYPLTVHWPRLIRMPARIAIYFGLTLLVASISYYVIERPFLRLKERLR